MSKYDNIKTTRDKNHKSDDNARSTIEDFNLAAAFFANNFLGYPAKDARATAGLKKLYNTMTTGD